MTKLSGILSLVFMFLMANVGMADLVGTSAYYAADAAAQTGISELFSEHDEGPDPVEVSAAGVEEGIASATARANLLEVMSQSAVDMAPDNIGAAVGSAGSLLVDINFDISWTLDIESIFSIDQAKASAGVTGEALVTDKDGSEVYKYVLTEDGPYASVVIDPGSYDLALYVTSFSILPEPSENPESANSSIVMDAEIAAIPEPSTALLGFVAIGLAKLLRKRRIL